MLPFSRLGRLLFAAAAGLGAQHLLRLDFAPGLEPVPAGVPFRAAIAIVYGLVLLLGGGSLLLGIRPRLGAMLLAAGFGGATLLFQFPSLALNFASGNVWTRSFESLAMAAAACALAAGDHGGGRALRAPGIARIAFGVALVTFGALHFLYLEFTATLVPVWIPARLFWAGFVGACFLAAGLAQITGIRARLAALWVGAMFAGFVALLHIPLVAADIHLANHWTSFLVAVLMWGGAWIVAGAPADARPWARGTRDGGVP